MTKENFLIRLKDVFFSYGDSEVLKNISLKIEEGEFIAILGKNGSGKTTFLKLLNALLLPSSGDVLVNGYNTKIPENTYKIRSTSGLVLQNPDSQIINSIVEEDIAFGPENLGLSQEEIKKRVEESLKLVESLFTQIPKIEKIIPEINCTKIKLIWSSTEYSIAVKTRFIINKKREKNEEYVNNCVLLSEFLET